MNKCDGCDDVHGLALIQETSMHWSHNEHDLQGILTMLRGLKSSAMLRRPLQPDARIAGT